MKTYFAPSVIDGYGLFAGEHIPAGTSVWSFDPRVDLILEANCVDQLPIVFKVYFKKYAYLDMRMRKYIICGDDARFINHSDSPSLAGVYPADREYGIDVALREIREGEELTSDYSTFDSDFGSKLNLGPARIV